MDTDLDEDDRTLQDWSPPPLPPPPAARRPNARTAAVEALLNKAARSDGPSEGWTANVRPISLIPTPPRLPCPAPFPRPRSFSKAPLHFKAPPVSKAPLIAEARDKLRRWATRQQRWPSTRGTRTTSGCRARRKTSWPSPTGGASASGRPSSGSSAGPFRTRARSRCALVLAVVAVVPPVTHGARCSCARARARVRRRSRCTTPTTLKSGRSTASPTFSVTSAPPLKGQRSLRKRCARARSTRPHAHAGQRLPPFRHRCGVRPHQLPAMARMALRMPDLFLRPIPLLRIGQAKSITLTQEQVWTGEQGGRAGGRKGGGREGGRAGGRVRGRAGKGQSLLCCVWMPLDKTTFLPPSATLGLSIRFLSHPFSIARRLRACWQTPSFAPTRAVTPLRARASTPAFRASTLTGTSPQIQAQR